MMSQKTRYSIRGMFHLLSDKKKYRMLLATSTLTSMWLAKNGPFPNQNWNKQNNENSLSYQKAMLEIGYRKKDELIWKKTKFPSK